MSPRVKILSGLRDGLGVEDIAVREEIPAKQVRAIVAELRREGILPSIYNQRCPT